jgi:hypothetical protein
LRRALIVAALLCVSSSGWIQTKPTIAALNINPTEVDFAPQSLNTQSKPAIITLNNQSQAPTSIQEILTSGIDFPSENHCGNQLAPGAQCTVQISFKPVITGEDRDSADHSV